MMALSRPARSRLAPGGYGGGSRGCAVAEQRGERTTAVVVGASMAGLLAARVLSGHVDEVILVERDRLEAAPRFRRGVPQAKHPHALLVGGQLVLEELFPGFTDDVISRGGLTGDLAGNGRIFINGGWLARYESRLTLLYASRPLIETVTRERVLAIGNVRLREECTVDGLLMAQGRVTGVRLRHGDSVMAEVAADLVVIAVGRSAAPLAWLREHGYVPPAEEAIGVDLTYVTRAFRRRPDDLGGARFAMILAQPPHRRSGAVFAQENDIWLATMVGILGERAPSDIDGFRGFARSLPSPELGELLTVAEPVGDAAVWHFGDSRRLRYERLSSLPRGYLVLGDGISSFNPVYGQGMSVAAQQARVLDQLLRKNGRVGSDPGLAQRYFRAAASIVDVPWMLAAGLDLRYRAVPGRRTLMTRLINPYVDRLLVAAQVDTAATDAFLRVNDLIEPPSALFAPSVVTRVLAHRFRGGAPRRPLDDLVR